MNRQQNITLKIADVSPISMKVPAQSEEVYRRAEYNINYAWEKWRRDFPDRTPKEILAMIAIRFAKLYFQLQEQVNDRQNLLDNFEKELDRLLDIVNTADNDATLSSAR